MPGLMMVGIPCKNCTVIIFKKHEEHIKTHDTHRVVKQ